MANVQEKSKYPMSVARRILKIPYEEILELAKIHKLETFLKEDRPPTDNQFQVGKEGFDGLIKLMKSHEGDWENYSHFVDLDEYTDLEKNELSKLKFKSVTVDPKDPCCFSEEAMLKLAELVGNEEFLKTFNKLSGKIEPQSLLVIEPDYSAVLWGEQRFAFGLVQAKVIKFLHTKKAPTFTAFGYELLSHLHSQGHSTENIDKNFQNHAAWGLLLVKAEDAKAMFYLNILPNK